MWENENYMSNKSPPIQMEIATGYELEASKLSSEGEITNATSILPSVTIFVLTKKKKKQKERERITLNNKVIFLICHFI